jgi:acyl-ACP thioesterase
MSSSKYINKYAVVAIYNEGDGAQPLVHVEDVFCCISAAKKFAKEVAQDMLKTYNNGMDKENRLRFKDVWEKVDNREEDEFLDWGYDPIDGIICWRVRVTWYTEEA